MAKTLHPLNGELKAAVAVLENRADTSDKHLLKIEGIIRRGQREVMKAIKEDRTVANTQFKEFKQFVYRKNDEQAKMNSRASVAIVAIGVLTSAAIGSAHMGWLIF